MTLPSARAATVWSSEPFRWLFGGQVVSMAGNQLVPMIMVALTLRHAQHPALAMGAVMSARFAAMAIFIVLGGVLADRMDRFRVLALTDVLSIAALLPVVVLGVDTPLAVLTVSSFVLGACEALFTPAHDAAVVSVVPPDRLAQANALVKAARGIAKVLGPPLGGVLVAALGVRAALVADMASFGLSLLTLGRLMAMRLHVAPTGPRPGWWREALDGLRVVLNLRWLAALQLMALVHVLFAVGPWLVLLPLVAQRSLGGIESYGLLLGAFAAGTVLGALLGGRVNSRRPGLVLLGGLMPFGLCCVALGMTTHLGALLAFLFVAGIGVEVTDVLKVTQIQKQVPHEFLGRVFALDFFASFVTMPLGQLLAGWLVAPGSERAALVVAGLVVLVTTPLMALVPGMPALKHEVSAAGGVRGGTA